jgi:predicted Zn-dependent protease
MAFLTLAALVVPSALRADDKDKKKTPTEDSEVKIGREGAAENDHSVKLITEPALVERVNRIGQEIAAIANVTEVPAIWGTSTVKKFNYTFKVVDDKDVNAYSLPGGFIYVHKGLLDYVHSDDELAGVLAHEVAHAAHHHMIKLLREQSKMQPWALLALAASVAFSKDRGDSTTKVALATQLYMTAKLNSMGIEAEKDADQAGLRYLTKTKYSPVGLLTFMERLGRDEQQSPDRELGIFRTHPPSPERAKSALAELDELKIPVNRRDADPTLRAVVTSTTANGVKVAEVKMFKTVVARLTATGTTTPEDRGKALAQALNQLFDQGLQMYELHITADKSRIIARNQTVVIFTDADADAQKSTVAQLSQNGLEAIKSLLWQDQFNKPVGNGTSSYK